jgi:hypothetical protein
MYGTIGRLRIVSGFEANLVAQLNDFSERRVPGARAIYLYRTDGEPDCFQMVVMFENKEAYRAYTNSGQTVLDELSCLLQSSAEWNNGEIIYECEIAYGGL